MIESQARSDRATPGSRVQRIGAALILAATVAGCGSGSSDSSPGPSASAGLASSPNASATVLPVAMPSVVAAAPTPAVTPLPAGVIAEIPLDPGVAPFGIVSDGKKLWVAAHRASSLYRIDPGSNQVLLKVDVGQEASCGMPGVGFGSIWLPPCDDSTSTVVIDTTSGSLKGAINGTNTPAVGQRTIWTVADVNGAPTAATYDPRTLALVGPTASAGGFDGYIVVGGSVWGIAEDSLRIGRIDPATHAVQATFMIPGFASDDSLYTAVLGDAIWIKGYQSGTLVKFDASTQKFTHYEIPGYGRPSGYFDEAPVAALGSVWLRISDTSVVRVDPATGSVTATYPAGPGGGAVAVDFGSLWVANFGTDTVWRERIQP